MQASSLSSWLAMGLASKVPMEVFMKAYIGTGSSDRVRALELRSVRLQIEVLSFICQENRSLPFPVLI